ncbi:putative MFS glucose transporter [Taphrina deformans PYCC 5710]|uniref:MFS glucose transporter n=1 Tax=Taphrina deformans (strain PYCC 5710 / ATCC 11124 / CBS 356.35 / IMI 108563 / JCM 9778 / NBRC 8474) TaxID=1097556 RepID=R4XFS7_TAPDE|nr:putative MFS glucose transporter [Taphrina deformans PYCC 5710]|eukprot:CCG82219.1 putative MFS glucose transporter [Taphrina deformans PYCC 5710]
MSTANAMWSLGAGRLVSGVASGVALVLTPIYLNEISPLAIRGTVGAMTQVSCVFGILIAQIAGVYFSTATGWRLILGFGGMIGFVQFILLWFTVESPKWLTSQPGEFAHAKYLLRKIRGRSDIESEMRLWKGEDEDEEVSATMEHRGLLYVDLHSSVHSEDEVRSTMSLGTFLTDTKLRPAVRAIFITQFAFTGTNAVVFYSTSILASLLPDLSAWISVGISLVNFLVTLVAANLVDRAGRKILILTSIAGMAISSALLAVGINGDYKVLSAVAAASIIGSFGLGLGPVPFLLISEYFEAETVGIAQSLGISVSWAATFTVGFLFPVMKQNLGGSSFYVFAVSAVLFFFLTLRYVPESKGKTVREIWLTT